MCGGLLQGKAWSCISQGSYGGLKVFTSVCISWYGRQLIIIISDLVPSKKQISRIGACSLIGRASSNTNCLSVWICVVSFLNFSNDSLPKTSNRTTEGYSSNLSCELAGVVTVCARINYTEGH